MKCEICKCEYEENKEFIYAPKSKKYYWFCLECYLKSKYFNKKTFDNLLKESKEIIESNRYEKMFYDLVHKTFGYLDNRFFIKKNQINNGTFKTKTYNSEYSNFKITNKELYEMLDKMLGYLIKTTSKLSDKTSLPHYVLSIIYNSYPKYLEHKCKVKEINSRNVEVAEVTKEIIEKSKNKNENSRNNINLDEFLIF